MRIDSAASRGGPGSAVGIDEESIVGRLGGSQSHYNELRERRKQEYLGYLEQEIRLKKALKEVEDGKLKQKEMQLDEKLKMEREIESRRLQEERARDLEIDYGSIEKNRKKFDNLFQQDGAADDILDKFVKEEVFGNKKPTNTPQSGPQPAFRREGSFGPEDFGDAPPRNRGSQAETDDNYNQQTYEIRKLQSENLRYQMETEKELRPQVNNLAQIQGYGMNRQRKPSAGEPMGVRDYEFEQQAALGRWDQNIRDRYALQDRANPLPFLPTAKEIIANQVTRDVKDEMLRMRGAIISNMDQMRRDVERIKSDAVKSDTRFKYAQRSYQDQLQKEMAQRDDMVVDILDGVRGWKPGGIAYASRNGIKEVTIEKAPEWRIPVLDFTEVTRELKEKLDALKGIKPVRNPESLMLQKQTGPSNVQGSRMPMSFAQPTQGGGSKASQPTSIQFNQYISSDQLQEYNLKLNPESKFITQALEQERSRIQQERSGGGPTRRSDQLASNVDQKRSQGVLRPSDTNMDSQPGQNTRPMLPDNLLSTDRADEPLRSDSRKGDGEDAQQDDSQGSERDDQELEDPEEVDPEDQEDDEPEEAMA